MKQIFFILIAVWALLLVYGPAKADTFTVHLASDHITSSGIDYGFNESNLGVGYGKTINSHVRGIVGGYDNSLDLLTLYGGVEFYSSLDNPFLTEVGIDIGFVTGYEIPVGAAAYVRLFNVGRVTAMPLVINGEVDGMVLGYGLTFGE
jgi:hypothetical protein